MAIWSGPIDISNPNTVQPEIGIICDAGEDARICWICSIMQLPSATHCHPMLRLSKRVPMDRW